MTTVDHSADPACNGTADDGNNNNTASSSTIDNHYGSHTASSYESAFFYSPGEYNDWLCATVKSVLLASSSSSLSTAPHATITPSSNHDDTASAMQQQERRRRVLMDVGGGTGNFTRALLTAMNDDNGDEQWEAIVVDPYLRPNDNNDDVDGGVESSTKTSMDTAASIKNDGIRFVVASARDFIQTTITTTTTTTEEKEEEKCDDTKIQNSDNDNDELFWKSGYDCVLLKEVIHHIDPTERVAIFTGLKHGFFVSSSPSSSSIISRNTPSLLIVTRPKHDINYPLWPQACDVWSMNQPCTQQIVSDLQLAGYNNVIVQIYTYPCTVQLGRWLRMIKNRFWSTFATFTNEELYLGCEYIVNEAQSKSSAAENGQSSSSSSSVTIENNNDFVLQFEERLVFITASVV